MALFDDINEVRLMGNVTNDPELRFTPSGSAVLNFGMATNRSYKQGETWQEEVTYHNIVVWGNQAQSLSTRIQKGTKVHVAGRIQVRSWDGNDGKKNYKTEVVADNVILIDRYNREATGGAPADNGDMDSAPKKRAAKKATAAEEEPAIDPDELPF